MAADNTAALVVALSAQLTKFENDMKKAGDIADKTVSGIEDRFSKANPAFSGTFLGSFLGNFASTILDKALKSVEDLVDRFVQLETLSKQVGISMRELFTIQEAFKEFKGPVEEVNAAIKTLAVSIDVMQRGGDNDLSKLLDANKAALAVRGFTKETLTAQQAVIVLADIVSNFRKPVQALEAVRLVGITEGLLPALKEGGDKIQELIDKANKGAPDFEKIAAASKAFNESWKEVGKLASDFFGSQSIAFFRDTLVEISTILVGIANVLAAFKGIPLFDTLGAQEAVKFLKENAAELDAKISQLRGETTATAGAKRIQVTGGTFSGPPSNLPAIPVSGTRDAFERETEKITKHIATLNADTAAIFLNNSAQAQLRAEFSLLNAARLSGANITQEQIDAYEKLRSQGIEPLVALTQLHINLSEKQKAALISASEGARIAQANFDAANSSLQKINSASQQLGSALSSAFADAIVEGKSLNDVLASLIKTLEKAVINAAFADIFSPQGGNKTSLFGSLFTGHAAGTNYAPGGWSWVGEQGPELMRLPRGSQVMPNDVATGLGGGGGSPIIFSPHIDARGADVAAVAKLAQIMAEQRKNFTRDVINAVHIGRKGRHL